MTTADAGTLLFEEVVELLGLLYRVVACENHHVPAVSHVAASFLFGVSDQKDRTVIVLISLERT